MKNTNANNQKNDKVIAVCAALAAAMAMAAATVMVASASSADIGTTNETAQVQTAAQDTKAEDKANATGKHPGESGYCYEENQANA